MIREMCTFRPHPTNIDKVSVFTTCCDCHSTVQFDMDEAEWFAGLDALNKGALMQNAFPNLKPEWRELLISRICPPCFDAITHD